MEPGTDQERRRRFRLRRSGKRGAWALRNWRVRTRLLAVILIPITAAVLLGGLRLGSAVQDANEYERVRTLTRLAEHTTALAHDLENERDLAAVYIASDRNIDPAQLNAQRASVDQAVVLFRAQAQDIDSSYGPLVNSKLTAVSHQLATLDALRDSALTSKLPALAAINAYSAVISALLSVDVEIAGDANSRALSEKSRALDAFSRAKDSASRQRAILGAVLTSGRFQPDELESFLFADEQQASALLDFDAVAQPAQQAMFEDTVTGTDIDKAELTKQLAIARQTTSTGRLAADVRLKPDEWFSAMTNKLDLMRVVEARLVDGLLTQSADLQGAAQRSALLVSVLVLLILVFALGATLAVAQSMVGPLQILRSSALDVAGRRLPEVVRVLRDSDGSRLDDIKVERTSIDSTDEIGEVARAFDEVHSEAVRLATEQALLRSSVNAMFVNLSRRSQSLVERQLRLIDDLENAEQDPDQLSSLFKLDHLATRMRRNGENLLVLAGEEAGRRWSAPVPLLDVIRASTSEVEQYERVQLRGLPMADVAGRAVNDVVHLIAELLENATAYSSPETKVLVTSQLLNGGGAMIEIEDRGIGMTAKELEDANFRLQNPPVVDVSVARRMGLFVVGRLAGRHGIRVQLRKSSSGGITALVMLPEQLVLDHSGDAAAQPGQTRQPSLFDSESKGAQAARPPVPAAGQPGQSRPVTPGAGSQPGSVPAVRPSAPSSPVPYNGAPAEPPATLPPFGPVSRPPAKPPTAIPRQTPAIRALEPGTPGRDAPETPATDDVWEAGGDRPEQGRDDRVGQAFSGPQLGLDPSDDGADSGRGFGGAPGRDAGNDSRRQEFIPPSFGPPEEPTRPEPAPAAGSAFTGPVFTGPSFGEPEQAEPPYSAEPQPEPTRPEPTRPEPMRPEPMRPEPMRPEPTGQYTGRDTDRDTGYDTGYGYPSNEPVHLDSGPPAPGGELVPRAPDSSKAVSTLNGEDRLPIFEAVESEWFRRRSRGRFASAQSADSLAPEAPAAQSPTDWRPDGADAYQATGLEATGFAATPRAEADPAMDQSADPVTAEGSVVWNSPGDEAWRAADAIRKPTTAGLTPAGLPIRIPKAHFVPGSAGKPTMPTPTRAAARSPEAVRGRLASFHKGVQKGRDAGRGPYGETPQATPSNQEEESP